MPTSEAFKNRILDAFRIGADAGAVAIEIESGSLHRRLGGYPGTDHRMPVCCSVMRALMAQGDEVISEPPKGKGATLRIRYRLPRAT